MKSIQVTFHFFKNGRGGGGALFGVVSMKFITPQARHFSHMSIPRSKRNFFITSPPPKKFNLAFSTFIGVNTIWKRYNLERKMMFTFTQIIVAQGIKINRLLYLPTKVAYKSLFCSTSDL